MLSAGRTIIPFSPFFPFFPGPKKWSDLGPGVGEIGELGGDFRELVGISGD